jgi:hypothetical protein
MNTVIVWFCIAIPAWLLQVSPVQSPAEPCPPWLPRGAFHAAKQGFIDALTFGTPQMAREDFGISDTTEARSCEVRHPHKLIAIRYDRYITGDGIRGYFYPVKSVRRSDFGFEIYCGERYAGIMWLAFKDKRWELSMVGGNGGRTVSPMDSVSTAYPVSAGFTIYRDVDTGACFVFKGRRLVAAFQSGAVSMVPMNPYRFMERMHDRSLQWKREWSRHLKEERRAK